MSKKKVLIKFQSLHHEEERTRNGAMKNTLKTETKKVLDFSPKKQNNKIELTNVKKSFISLFGYSHGNANSAYILRTFVSFIIFYVEETTSFEIVKSEAATNIDFYERFVRKYQNKHFIGSEFRHSIKGRI